MVPVLWSSVRPLGHSMLEVTKMRRLDPSIQAFSIRPMLSLTSSSSQSVQYIQLSHKHNYCISKLTWLRHCFTSGSIYTSYISIDHCQTQTNTDHSPQCPHFLTLNLDGCACYCLHQPPTVDFLSIHLHMTACFCRLFWKLSVPYQKEIRHVGSVLYTHGKAWLCSPLNLSHAALIHTGNIVQNTAHTAKYSHPTISFENWFWHCDKSAPGKLESRFPICKTK